MKRKLLLATLALAVLSGCNKKDDAKATAPVKQNKAPIYNTDITYLNSAADPMSLNIENMNRAAIYSTYLRSEYLKPVIGDIWTYSNSGFAFKHFTDNGTTAKEYTLPDGNKISVAVSSFDQSGYILEVTSKAITKPMKVSKVYEDTEGVYKDIDLGLYDEEMSITFDIKSDGYYNSYLSTKDKQFNLSRKKDSTLLVVLDSDATVGEINMNYDYNKQEVYFYVASTTTTPSLAKLYTYNQSTDTLTKQ